MLSRNRHRDRDETKPSPRENDPLWSLDFASRILPSFITCVFLIAIAARGTYAQPAPPLVGILPGEDTPHAIERPVQSPGSETVTPPGILPGEEVPKAVVSAMQAGGESLDWGVSRVGCGADLWTKYGKGKGVRVLVLDTGVDSQHPDLAAGLVEAKDFTGSRSGAADVNGHGSHCLGVVGARLDGQGLVGVAPECLLYSGKVLGDNGYGSDASIVGGIEWGVTLRVDVISMSLGGGYSKDIHAAVKRAAAAGIIVVAAAGNEGPGENTVGYPGGLAESVCVAASDKNDAVARFSSRGPAVLVAGPGVAIRSCYPGGRYAEMSGTSMATPHVAGAAALWCAANPGVPRVDRPARFRAALASTAKDLAPPGRDTATGLGLVRLAELLAGGQVNPPPPPPPVTPGVVLTEQDLTEDARRRLNATFPGGRFRLEIPQPQPQPKE